MKLDQQQPCINHYVRCSLALVVTLVLCLTSFFFATRPAAAQSGNLSDGGGLIAVTNYIGCTLTSSGGVKCWGSQSSGEIGDGTAGTPHPTPVDVVGLTSGVVAVSTNDSHTCAIISSGGVKCWGSGGFGALGNIPNLTSYLPVDVVGLSNVTALSVGSSYSCAIISGGGLKCWGANANGQLGDGTVTPRTPPVNVVGLSSGVVAVSAGNIHTCAVTSSGGVKCWGFNGYGQLGDGTTTDRLTPVDVSGLSSGVVAVSAGDSHTCALTSSGGVKCWGANANGRLGDGTTTSHSTPVDVMGLSSGVVGISAGATNSCVVTSSGGLKCWGGGGFGGLGDGAGTNRLTPVGVIGLNSGVVAVSLSAYMTCAVTSSGSVKCWGRNVEQQLGTNDGVTNWYIPANVSGLGSGGGATTTNLAITKSASVTQATAGVAFDYTVTVTNNGATTATNVAIKDNLPAGITYNSATPSAGGSCGAPSGGVLTCTWPSVAASASVNVVIHVTP